MKDIVSKLDLVNDDFLIRTDATLSNGKRYQASIVVSRDFNIFNDVEYLKRAFERAENAIRNS